MRAPISYELWKRLVNLYCERLSGMDTEAFPDVDYRSMYERGVKPEAAARKALRKAWNS